MTTAVLIPGNMCDKRMWTDSVRQVLAGHGLTVIDADTTRDDTIADMAERALATTDDALLPVGFSMGGIVALEMARLASQRITAMVLSDTNAGADLPDRAAARPGQQVRVRDGELATIVADELKPVYLAAANRDDTELKGVLFDMAMQLGDDVFCAQSEALRTRRDNMAVLDTFTRPLLVTCGAEDALCPPEWHRLMADRASDATLAVIDDAGHMLPLEREHDFAAVLAQWLEDNGERLRD